MAWPVEYPPFASTYEVGVRSDHVARELDAGHVTRLVRAPRFTDLDLYARDPQLLHPEAELLPGLRLGVAGEPAAAVDRHDVACPAEQAGQRLAEQPGLEGPQR